MDDSEARAGAPAALTGTAQVAQVAPRSASGVTELTFWVTVSATTVAIVAWALIDTPDPTRDTALPVFVLGAGAMFGLGLIDMVRGRDGRFARALTAGGVLWSLSALTASDRPIAYTVGHVSQWFVYLAIAYLLLSYPSGRLADRSARHVFAAGACLLAVLFVPTALMGELPHPSLWSACTSVCPANAFSLTHTTPTLITDVIVPLREVLAVALFSVIAALVIRRARGAEQLLGQLYAPVAALAVCVAVMFAVYFPLRALAPDSRALSVVGWIFVLSLPAIGLACGTGRMYRRIHTANVLELVARRLAGSSTPADVRAGLADALQDPSLRILHSFPGDSSAWVDESGQPVLLASAPPSQRITQISSGNWRIAMLHDPVLAGNPSLLMSAGSYALATMENQSLTDELDGALLDLASSRASRLTAEQDTRQKIERDLHDGAQQRLVALRMKVGLAASTLEGRDPAGAETLHELEHEIDVTIDEIRSLASGIYPPLLARAGLGDALRAAALAAALPTTVSANRIGRYSTEVETTVYFSCSEALQNAAKHAVSATLVTISVWENRELHFEVRDDGGGFDVPTTPWGRGLTNLSDRLSAVGGTIRLESTPGQGTVLGGSIPLE
ncbi:MAG TPA: histidine kinase [Solirubrobacteraceae bacterium]|nr:histidine kinase [Solirubrobacteraceae bacterium]